MVIRAILQGIPLEVKPSGGKYGFEQRIKLGREYQKNSGIFGIRDRDYDIHDGWNPVNTDAMRWTTGAKRTHLGWIWQLTDIESYLTSPTIVEAMFESSDWIGTYAEVHQTAKEQLKSYTACRVALGRSRKGSRLPNKFGRQSKYFSQHCLPEDLSNQSLEEELLALVHRHNGDGIVVIEDVQQLRETTFASIESTPDAHSWFSGKDIVLQIGDWLAGVGFATPKRFLDETAKRLKNSQEEIWKLLPEWQSLRHQVSSIK